MWRIWALERIFEVIPWVAGPGFWRSLNIQLLVYIKRTEVIFFHLLRRIRKQPSAPTWSLETFGPMAALPSPCRVTLETHFNLTVCEIPHFSSNDNDACLILLYGLLWYSNRTYTQKHFEKHNFNSGDKVYWWWWLRSQSSCSATN